MSSSQYQPARRVRSQRIGPPSWHYHNKTTTSKPGIRQRGVNKGKVSEFTGPFEPLWQYGVVTRQMPGGRFVFAKPAAPRLSSVRAAVRRTKTEELVISVLGRLAETPEYYDPEDYPAHVWRFLSRAKLRSHVLDELGRYSDTQANLLFIMNDITGFKWEEIGTIWVDERAPVMFPRTPETWEVLGS